MYGVSIDDDPDAPVGTPATRRTIAIHWNWTTEYTREEMANALGVTPQTIRAYIREGPTGAVKDKVADLESEVRTIAVMELRQQLKEAGHRARTAETPVKVWADDSGNLRVEDKVDEETGRVVGKYPVPADMELGADEQARYYARGEIREILEQLTDLVGAAEPEEHEVSLIDALEDTDA